jgi:hypothetical protein
VNCLLYIRASARRLDENSETSFDVMTSSPVSLSFPVAEARSSVIYPIWGLLWSGSRAVSSPVFREGQYSDM